MLSQSFRSLQAAKLYKVPKGAEGSADGGKALFSLLNVSAAKVTPNPYPHLLVENFLSPQALRVINEDFPELLDVVAHVEEPELRKLGQIRGRFADLLTQLDSKNGLRQVLADRFGVDLTKCHTRFSMRGISVPEDGHVHTDDYKKVVTVLIYLNEHWNHNGPGGHLRLLNSGSLEDVAEQVPAWGGRLLAFANTSPTTRGWHGYTSFSGQRRAIQINWMTEMRKNKYVSLKELKEKLKEAREKRDADNKIRAKAVTKVQAAAEVLSKNPKIKKAKSKLAVAAGDVL